MMRSITRWAFVAGALALLVLLAVGELQGGATWRTTEVRGIYFSADRGTTTDSVMQLSDATYYPVQDTAGNVVYIKTGGTVISVITSRDYMTSDNATIWAYPSTASDTTGQGTACTYTGNSRHEWYLADADFGQYDFYEVGGSPDTMISYMDLRVVMGATAPDSFVTTAGLQDEAITPAKMDSSETFAIGGLRINTDDFTIAVAGDTATATGQIEFDDDVSFNGDMNLGDANTDAITVYGYLQVEDTALLQDNVTISFVSAESLRASGGGWRVSSPVKWQGAHTFQWPVTFELMATADSLTVAYLDADGEGGGVMTAQDMLVAGQVDLNGDVDINNTITIGDGDADSCNFAGHMPRTDHDFKVGQDLRVGRDFYGYDDGIIEDNWTVGGTTHATERLTLGENAAGGDGQIQFTDGSYYFRLRAYNGLGASATMMLPANPQSANAVLMGADGDSTTDWKYPPAAIFETKCDVVDVASPFRIAYYHPEVYDSWPNPMVRPSNCDEDDTVPAWHDYSGSYCKDDSVVIVFDGSTGPAGLDFTYIVGPGQAY
jgi:hypothetical protein